PLRELHFLRSREEAVATDLVQVERERIGGSCAWFPRVASTSHAASSPAKSAARFAPGIDASRYRSLACSTSARCSSAHSASATSSSVADQPRPVSEYSTRTGTSA